MSHIVWTPHAAEQLEMVYKFLAEKNEDAARKALEAIQNHVSLLKTFRNAGRPCYDLEPEHRELLIPFSNSGYVLLYQVQDEIVYILAIRHQRELGYI